MAPSISSEIASQSRPRGLFVAVVGPSGAGKDSVIAGARAAFATEPRVVFARRLITRPADGSEDHQPIDPQDFATLESAGGMCLSWRANGLCYGLPAVLTDDLRRGAIVIANLSRDMVGEARSAFARTIVVHVTAKPGVIAERLSARGRETKADQSARMARSFEREKTVEADVRIENNGALADAQAAFVRVIATLLKADHASEGPLSRQPVG